MPSRSVSQAQLPTDFSETSINIVLPSIDAARFDDIMASDRSFTAQAHKAACRDLFDACGSGAFNKMRDIGVRVFTATAAVRGGSGGSNRQTPSSSSSSPAVVQRVVVDAVIGCAASGKQAMIAQASQWLASPKAMTKIRALCVDRVEGSTFEEGIDTSLVVIDRVPLGRYLQQ